MVTGDGAAEHRVVFTPSGLVGEVTHGTTVLDAARTLGVDLDSVCGGKGLCGRCQVVPTFGTHAKWQVTAHDDHLTLPGVAETAYHGRRPLGPEHRLGCATRILGDMVFDVPSASQLHRQVVRKGISLDDLVIDPMVGLHYIEVPPEGATNAGESAINRIRFVLAETWNLHDVHPHVSALAQLHTALTTHGGAMTVAVRDRLIVAAWAGLVDQLLGVAIDIGSTTIAGHLVDLSSGEVLAAVGRMNPQIRYGEDLMSRVSYAMMNPGGATALTAAVQFELDTLVGELVEEAGVDRATVVDIVVVGNPIMHHLVLGLDPAPLGQAPFTLATSDAVVARATDIGIGCPTAQAYVGPCLAGHVGADTAAAILAEGLHRQTRTCLLIDVGTNAEIVLGNNAWLYAASSPTGPAFEGAQLSCGQRATSGAIERVRIDAQTGEPRYTIIGSSRWSDDPEFASDARALGLSGVCGSGIIELVAELYLAGLIDEHGVLRNDHPSETDRIVADGRTFAYVIAREPVEIRLTQADIRAVQLAKAALRAGIDLLLEHAGIPAVDEIRLAGAFGAHIDPQHAMVLGLIPDAPLDSVRSVGNAASNGAIRALVSRQQREEMETTIRHVRKIETALEPRFQALFVDALAIPHARAATPHLAEVVALPPREIDHPGGVHTRRRRTKRHAS